ncbi:hypothetical protein EHS25_004078 [Saitozyma podzolica]|uniref:Uncharacterized protein n=1 Tax=Saitozyma podzolica TaxID=1890683 RepID=A0A427YTF7_9TREE|nr:hypothetical protein EHS25_004078 [Saitozyma podzolica]
MFGAIVAGRLVQTNLQQIDETHFVFPLEQPYEINHLTVFLLGTIPFPEGYGASVHFAWPGKDYIPLGVLTNSKPSSIYRLRPHLPSDLPPNALASPPATLGIEIAPLPQLEALAAQLSAGGEGKGKEIAGKVDVGKVAEKVVKNLFNYLHSFGESKLTPDTPIPLSVFQRWYDNFLRKIENDRGASFLDRED